MRGTGLSAFLVVAEKSGSSFFLFCSLEKTIIPLFEILDFKENTPIASWE